MTRLSQIGRGITLLITFAIKIAGLASAVNQLLLQTHATPLVLAVSAFMMAGAQFSEGLILQLFDRLFGASVQSKEDKK